ncbi:MAG: DUF4982 domain-containing protein [Lachnospiraceae bacterium]|nr:DUF4982 domain-containing protein [Lachnospiraceae bacterium]
MKKISFNSGWSCNGQAVTLPHDAQITEKRSAEASNGGHGYFPGGVYTYEKVFMAPAEWEGKAIILEFEGVYKNAAVSLNGKQLTFRPYGYTNFFVELEDLKTGAENTLTVVADNSKLPNSRWYSGAGIYRPVWVYVCEKNGLRPQSVKISTVSIDPAVIHIHADVPVKAEAAGAAGEGSDFDLTISGAQLWSDENPYLYTAKITAGAEDTMEIPFGIRQITWSNKGLFINGRETLLRGGCVHHDSGILGAATYAESEERRVRILKENGFNAIRSSHNPASTAMLEACDRLGMYVMDETFDMWYNRKNPHDYGVDFNEWWERDTAAMVERDYNHPSVILYSIGNEVAEPAEAKGVETGRAMVDLCHRIDPTRPVTCGTNLMIISRAAKGQGIYQDGEQKTGGGKPKKEKENQNASLAFNIMASFVGSGMNKGGNSKKVDALTTPFLDSLDIAGYNYGSGRYPLEAKAHPDRVVFGSETFPQDIYKNWQMVKQFPYLVGDFMWTSWDYLGEAGIGAWSYSGGMPFNRPYPWLLAGAGVIDINGIPDASCKYAATVWGLEDKPVIGVRPVNHPGVRPSKSVWRGTNAMLSWSWAKCEGNKAIVEVYSDQPQVELFLNGQSLGKKKTKECKAIFKVKYAPGTLAAASYDAAGKETGRSELTSAAGSYAPVVRPEKSSAAPGEILYVPVNIEGTDGIVESNADRKLTVTVEGGELLAFGSANPCTEEQYHTGSFTTFYGRALAIVRAGDAGQVVVKATDGEHTASAVIPVTA